MRGSRISISVALAGLALASCTTTYTEADLAAEEARLRQQARDEEKADRQRGEAGGTSMDAIEREKKWLEREGDL